jgi:hypothetical protein
MSSRLLPLLLVWPFLGVGCDGSTGESNTDVDASVSSVDAAIDAAPANLQTIRYWNEVIYPRKAESVVVENSIVEYEFLGNILERKELSLSMSLEVWGYSEELNWSYVFNYDKKELHIIFLGKSQFIRDPVRHDFSTVIAIDEPSSAADDWHADWEVFISLEKPDKCSFHEPSSFQCYDWVSIGRF